MAATDGGRRSTMNVMVTVDEGHRGELASVADRLASAGLAVADTSALGGVIVGAVATADLAKLHRVRGVQAIEEEPVFTAER